MDLRKAMHFQVHLPVSFSGDRVAGAGQDSSGALEVAAVRRAMGRDLGVEFIRLTRRDQEQLRQFLQTLETSPGT